MGALIGPGIPMGLSYAEILELCRLYANPKALFDYTLPLTSLMASRKLTKVMKILFEDIQIQDLWLPYFCMSVNLTRAEPVIHRKGPLWKCVRSSIAIPGIFTPILHEGEVRVDGGVMKKFPVDTMRGFSGIGTVIGVNVSRPHELTKKYDFGWSVSGWQVLWSRLNPFVSRAHVPSLMGNPMRTLGVNAVHQMKSSDIVADLLIQPDVRQFSSMDYAAFEQIVDAGYQAALPKLREWQKVIRRISTTNS